jgi:hypothetical protein
MPAPHRLCGPTGRYSIATSLSCSTALFCTLLHCPLRYCSVLHSTALHYTVRTHYKLYFPIPSHPTLSQSTQSLPTSSHPILSHPTLSQRTSPSIFSFHLTSPRLLSLSSSHIIPPHLAFYLLSSPPRWLMLVLRWRCTYDLRVWNTTGNQSQNPAPRPLRMKTL